MVISASQLSSLRITSLITSAQKVLSYDDDLCAPENVHVMAQNVQNRLEYVVHHLNEFEMEAVISNAFEKIAERVLNIG